MSKTAYNAPRRTGTLPKKYSLSKPDNRKDINGRLGLPDFFPLDASSPEDCLKQRTITDGFLEPKFVNDESSTMRKQMTGGMISELKGQLLHSIYETEWRRSVLKGDAPSQATTTGGSAGGTVAQKRGPAFPDQVGVSPAAQKQWITRLAGSEPLSKLAQQVPHTSKGDPLLKLLLDANVPVLRATWYIKIIYLNMLRATKKSIDPPTEWTTTLTKFLSSLIKEDIQPSNAARGNTNNTNTASIAQKHTKLAYVIKLIRWNYSEGLLDKEMFLGHVIDQLNESVRPEDGHTFAHLLYPYLPDVAASPALARRLYSACTAKRAKITPSLPSSILFRMLDGTLLDIVKYFNLTTENLSGPNTDNVNTPHTPRTPHTPHAPPVPTPSIDTEYGAFDAPRLAEALDDATSQTDLDELYAAIFPVSLMDPPPSNSTPLVNNTNSNSQASNPPTLSSRSVSRRVVLLCEWAITPFRKNPYSIHIVTSVLTRYLKTHHPQFLLNGFDKSPFQNFLIEFLEMFVLQHAVDITENSENADAMEIDKVNSTQSHTSLDEACNHVARLFGELQRCGIFSHDNYVRYLISRGRLEERQMGKQTNPTHAHLHRKLLQSLPVGERGLDWIPRPRALHERNQRRAALLPHSTAHILPSPQPTAVALLDSILRGSMHLSELVAKLTSLPVYEQYCISEWVALACMHAVDSTACPQPPPPVLFNFNSSPIRQLTPLMLHSSLFVILAVKNHYVLARLLLWLLVSTTQPGYLYVAISMVRGCDEAFGAMEMLTELFDALARLAKSTETPPIASSCNILLAEILTKHTNTLLHRKWTEENPALVPIQLRTATPQQTQSANITPHTQAHIRTVITSIGPIPEAVEQIVKSSVSLDKITGAVLQLIKSTNDNKRTYVQHCAALMSLAEPSCAKLGAALRLSLSTITPAKQPLAALFSVGDLLIELVTTCVLPLDQMLQHTLLPMLEEFTTNISHPGPPLTQKIDQITAVVTFVLVLFGMKCSPPLKTDVVDSFIAINRTQLRVCVRDRKGACLLLAFPVMATLYNLLVHLPTKLQTETCDPEVLNNARVAVDTFMRDEDMAFLSLHHATTIYTYLKTYDTHTRRTILSTMHDPPLPDALPALPSKFPPLTKENCATLGPSLVLTAVQAISVGERAGRSEEGWCVDRVWLELQLVLDEWGEVDASAWSQAVRLLLALFACNNNWSIHPVFSRLLRRMGLDFQTHLIRATLAILASQGSALQQLPNTSGELALAPHMLAASPLPTQAMRRKQVLENSSEDSESDDEGIGRGLVRIISRCLDSAPVEICTECVNQLSSQLQAFTDASPYLDSLSLPTDSLQAAQRSIFIRVSMFMNAFGRLTALSPSQNGASGILLANPTQDAFIRGVFPQTLLLLAARPLVTCDSEVLLPHLLSAIQQLTQTDPNDPNTPPFKKLLEIYTKLRPSIPLSARDHFHKILPFLAPQPSSTPLHTPNNNSWSMLEDYPDAPLSPSQWGGVRMERLEPAYAKVAFNHAEPPPPKKLKL